jgi:hypothetical protein
MVCTEMCRLRSDGTRLVPYYETYVRRLLPAEYKMTSEARAQKSALLVSRIPSKADTGEVRTALRRNRPECEFRTARAEGMVRSGGYEWISEQGIAERAESDSG